MLTFIVTTILYLFAGCPDPDKGVTHPDLDAVLRDLETPAPTSPPKAVPTPAPKRALPPRRFEGRPFGGGAL